MGLRITIDLDDDDLRHFRLIMREARKFAAQSQPEDIIQHAESLLASAEVEKVPGFIGDRLNRLRQMIEMLTDHEWRLPQQETTRVLNALAYFSEPEDLIPDHIPAIGFLDDAIMIELVVRELRHELEAYEDFCKFRASRSEPRGVKARTTDVTREDWLANRRKELQERMRRRRKIGFSRGRKSPGLL